jgi:Pectate lyase superfamily protein
MPTTNFAAGTVITSAWLNEVNSHVFSGRSYDGLAFNVRDPLYGAKGDGTTDDTAAIQSAINAADTASGSGGALVVFPPGTYKITGTLELPSHIILEGGNCVIRQFTNNIPIISVKSTVDVQQWGIQNFVLEFASQQTSSQTLGVGIRVANTKLSYNWWVKNVAVNYACDGLLAPETSGSYAFTCTIENFTAVAASRWAINFSCDASTGGNTNVNVTNAWALQFNGSEIAGSKGFRFRACYASRFNSLYADHTQSTFCEFTQCEGLWGELTAESCDFSQTSAGQLVIMSFADCAGSRRLLKFISNTFVASGGGEIYMVRDTISTGTRNLDVDLYVSELNTYSGPSAIYEMVPSAGMRIYNKEARLDKTANLADFSPATPRIWTWHGYRRWARGNTASRPTLNSADIGYLYQDNTLDSDGKPIWWNGTAWVDYAGTVV